MMSHKMKSHDNCGKVVHRLCSNCISSVQEIHEDSIKFSLSSTDKGAVGFMRFSSGPLALLEPSTNSVLLSLC